MHKHLSHFKKKVVYIPLGIIVLIILASTIYGATHQPVYETAKAERREFVQEVSVNGKVVAANDVELGFERSGKVIGIPAKVGTQVKAGTTLAYLESGSLSASLLESQGRLQSEQARLDELLRGTRPEELLQAENSFKQTEVALEDAIIDAFVDSENAIRNNTDSLFENADTYNPDLIYYDEYEDKVRIEQKRKEVGDEFRIWKEDNKKLEERGYDEEYLKKARAHLTIIRSYLDNLVNTVSSLENNTEVSASALATYKSNVASARATVGASISSLNSADQAYQSANDTYELKKAGSTTGSIQIQEAAVKSAQANVLQARSALGDSVISAPFDGVVTKIDLRVGQLVTSGSPVVGMISNANFQVESFIPEADIAKVEVGDVGTTTLDAYGDDVTFDVVVTAIDLSETEVDGVSTYKTTLQFEASDDRIRSGMTANIDLVSETRQGVLSIPQTALISKAGKRTVMIMNANGKAESRDVKTGSIDNSGNIEIIEGVSEGDTVITNPPK